LGDRQITFGIDGGDAGTNGWWRTLITAPTTTAGISGLLISEMDLKAKQSLHPPVNNDLTCELLAYRGIL